MRAVRFRGLTSAGRSYTKAPASARESRAITIRTGISSDRSKKTSYGFSRRFAGNTAGDGSGGYNPQRYNRRGFQIEPTLSYAVNQFLGLNHFFNFGFLTEKETYNFEQYSYLNGIALTFASPAGMPDFTTPTQVTIYNTPALTYDYLRHHGAYVQDKIKLSRRLTVNAGFRWDYYNNYRPNETVRTNLPWASFFYPAP